MNSTSYFFSSKLSHCGRFIGEIVIETFYDVEGLRSSFGKEMNIESFTPGSERVGPLACLHTIGQHGLRLKMQPKSEDPILWHELDSIHHACITESKTAVVSLSAREELHLVAMLARTRREHRPCFWGFVCARGQYVQCLGMLNVRSLGLVFDLDETLVLANTLKSFDDRSESLQRKLRVEGDPDKRARLEAELQRYREDRALLKQFCDHNEVVVDGQAHAAEHERVPPELSSSSSNAGGLTRPVVRLPGLNTILTRINPAVRDTSVLVRMRPSWAGLRDYALNSNSRKRFEVYVCTMSEREYALEMWRLLDPDAQLIPVAQAPHRVVCVRADARKSLVGVFEDSQCHPGLALIVDDRLKVWLESDQPRVHVVPQFNPYHNPEEEEKEVAVLTTVEMVVRVVRTNFFKAFDSQLLGQLDAAAFDTRPEQLPAPLDVAQHLSIVEMGMVEGEADGQGAPGAVEQQPQQQPQEALTGPIGGAHPAAQPPVGVGDGAGALLAEHGQPGPPPAAPLAPPQEANGGSGGDPAQRLRSLILQHGGGGGSSRNGRGRGRRPLRARGRCGIWARPLPLLQPPPAVPGCSCLCRA